MKTIFLLNALFFPIISFSQSLLLHTIRQDKKLCITNIEKNETTVLDSLCNYNLKGYSIIADSLVCITENDEKKYFSIANLKHLLLKKDGFENRPNATNTISYYHGKYELKEIDYNIMLCIESEKKWEIINTKNGRKPECNSNHTDINKKFKIFAHPTLSNKGDFFIYNQEKWGWLSSTYKTFEVDMNTGKQMKLFHGMNTQISATDQYLLFNNLKNKYYIYDRIQKEKKYIKATSAFWLYK